MALQRGLIFIFAFQLTPFYAAFVLCDFCFIIPSPYPLVIYFN